MLKLWDPASGRELRTLEGHSRQVNACAVSPDGSFIVSAGDDGTLKLWDPASGRELRTLEGHSGAVNACAVSPDGRVILSASFDKTLKLWDPASGRELQSLPLPVSLTCVAPYPWLPCAAVGGYSGSVFRIDMLAIDRGPLIVTANERAGAWPTRCPACFEQQPIERQQLGQLVTCPSQGCETQLEINSFVVCEPALPDS